MGSSPGKRVLIVDDHEHIRVIVSTLVKHAGYQPLTASAGEEALACLAAGEPIDLMSLSLR